jgi:hypothetical protein
MGISRYGRPKDVANAFAFLVAPESHWITGTSLCIDGGKIKVSNLLLKSDLSSFSQAYLNKIALRLNQRPRETLGFRTPADKLATVLH